MSLSPPPRRPTPSGLVPLAGVAAYPAFLGTGWQFPPSFNRQTGSAAMAAGERDIAESIWIILSTNLGERIMLATFGSNLWSQVFTALTPTAANEIAHLVSNAIVAWEPRVQVEDVTVSQSALEGWVEIDISFFVRQTNTRTNLVYPFYMREPILPPPPG